MKKMLAMLLAALLLGCAAAEEDVTGEWYGLMQGIPTTLTLNTDGTYTVVAANDGMQGTWELSGADLTLDKGTADEVVFTYDAEAVSISMIMNGAAIMTFTRDPIETWEPAAVRADAALEDFAGMWDCDMIDLGNSTIVESDIMGVGLVVEIQGTHVVLYPLKLTGDNNTEGPVYEADGVYENGVLTVTAPAIIGMGEEMVYTINLLEDGMMAISFELRGTVTTYYMNAF